MELNNLSLPDMESLFQTTMEEAYTSLETCLEQDESGLWWQDDSGLNNTNTLDASKDDMLLQPLQKTPVLVALNETNNVHGIHQSMKRQASFKAASSLDNQEISYLQNVFSPSGLQLDFSMYGFGQTPRGQPGMKAQDDSSSTTSDCTSIASTMSSSPLLQPLDPMDVKHRLKPSAMTFVSASGKVKMICEVEKCTKVAQSRKRCKRHGGGPRCRFPGCTKSSQGKGRCRTHGGGKQCAVDGCSSGAQQRGFCSRHGGAKLCSYIDENGACKRHSRGNGMCAFHGGGKRCSVPDCSRSSRIQGMCAMHKRMNNETSFALP